jgi:hypothetical protein
VDQKVPFVDFTMFEPPTAVHALVVAHEIEVVAKFESAMLQLAPPFNVEMIPEPPAAKQTVEDGHEIVDSAFTPVGAF